MFPPPGPAAVFYFLVGLVLEDLYEKRLACRGLKAATRYQPFQNRCRHRGGY